MDDPLKNGGNHSPIYPVFPFHQFIDDELPANGRIVRMMAFDAFIDSAPDDFAKYFGVEYVVNKIQRVNRAENQPVILPKRRVERAIRPVARLSDGGEYQDKGRDNESLTEAVKLPKRRML